MSRTPDRLAGDDDLPCALLQTDADGRLLEVNSTLCRLVGQPREALLGQPVEELFTMAGRAMYQSYLLPMLRLHGSVEEFALAIRAADGTPRDMLIYANRRPDGLSIVLVPYRTRRAVDDDLLRVRRAADQAPGLLFHFMLQADGTPRFLYTSEAVRSLYGCTPAMAARDAQAVLGRLEPEDRARFAERGDDGLRHFLVRLPQPGAEPRWHEVHAVARGEADGSMQWHGHIADVTQRRALEAESASRVAAEQVRQAQTEFLGRISHELRSPLNAILGFSQLLLQDDTDPLSPFQQQQMALVHAAGEQLLHLVNDVLDISRLQSGSFGITLVETDLRAALGRCVALAGPQSAQAGIALQREDLDGAAHPLAVMADPRRLEQVLANLLSNAIKYNRRGGRVTARAMLRATPDGALACVEVEDTGPGLGEQQRRSLFQPFNRLGAEGSAVPGTGLGLVISRQLLEQMGGTLEVDSEPGRGSTFRVLLPWRPRSQDGVRTGPAGAAPAAGEGPRRSPA